MSDGRREGRKTPYSRPAGRSDESQRWEHDRFDKRSTGAQRSRQGGASQLPLTSTTPTAKLGVQNLHYEVSSKELTELFERIGPIVRCFIKYDRSGRSTGAATVVFQDVRDAIRARQEYDGANAKGQPISISFKPMREVQGIAGSATSANGRLSGGGGDLLGRIGRGEQSSLLARLGGSAREHQGRPPANAPKGPASGTRGTGRGERHPDASRQRQAPPAARKAGPGARRVRGPAATADSLDAELDAFMKAPSGSSESIHAVGSHSTITTAAVAAEGDTEMK